MVYQSSPLIPIMIPRLLPPTSILFDLQIAKAPMCTPFAMHWFISTAPDFVSFECFGCQKVCKLNCFSLACSNEPDIHLFCPNCAQYHDTHLNFSCPACLLRDEVDNCKAEDAESFVADALLLIVAHQRKCRITCKKNIEKIEEKKEKDKEEEKDYVLIDMNAVRDQK